MSIKAGGSWSGDTFTATVSAFNGKITKNASISASVSEYDFEALSASSDYTTSGILSYKVKQYVNGVQRTYSRANITCDASDIVAHGWAWAADKVAYSSGSKSVTVPKTVSGETTSLDITATYNAGWNACRAAVLDSDSTGTYYSGTITTKYDAPTGGAQARSVIYPYNAHTIHFYDIPDRK